MSWEDILKKDNFSPDAKYNYDEMKEVFDKAVSDMRDSDKGKNTKDKGLSLISRFWMDVREARDAIDDIARMDRKIPRYTNVEMEFVKGKLATIHEDPHYLDR